MREILQPLLERHRPAGPEEADFRVRMLHHLADHAHPFSRKTFDPGHFTASGWVLHPTRPAVLLIHHARLDRRLQPGGHLEPGDPSPVAAAAREVCEETGIPAADLLPGAGALFDLDIHEIPARPGEPAHLHLDLRFLFRAATSRIEAGDGVRAAFWVDLADWPPAAAGVSDRRVAAKLAAARGLADTVR